MGGVVILIYGRLFFISRFYLSIEVCICKDIGFNEYDKKKKVIRIFRKYFPLKYGRWETYYCFSEMDILKFEREIYKRIYSSSNLYLIFKGKQKIILIKS